MRALTRFTSLVFLSALSLITIGLLLPSSSRLSVSLQDLGKDYLWDWKESEENGLALVVFGDSWVDDGEGETGKGWVEVLCEEVCIPSLFLIIFGEVRLTLP
jgi:hypothetical protein